MKLNNILVLSDFSMHAEYALQRAAMLAEKHSCSLHYVHVLKPARLKNYLHVTAIRVQNTLPVIEAHAKKKLQELAEQYVCKRPVKLSVLSGNIINAILQYVQDNQIDLIVAGAHGYYHINDYILGTTAEALIRQSPVPVLLAEKKPVSDYQRIIISTDFSDISRHTVEFSYFCFPNAGFQLLHVIDIYHQKKYEFLKSLEESPEEDQMSKDALEMLDDFLNTCKVPPSAFQKKILGGYIADLILRQSQEWQADLIAFGTQGHSKLHYFLLGSVATQLLRLNSQDMLIIPSKHL